VTGRGTGTPGALWCWLRGLPPGPGTGTSPRASRRAPHRPAPARTGAAPPAATGPGPAPGTTLGPHTRTSTTGASRPAAPHPAPPHPERPAALLGTSAGPAPEARPPARAGGSGASADRPADFPPHPGGSVPFPARHAPAGAHRLHLLYGRRAVRRHTTRGRGRTAPAGEEAPPRRKPVERPRRRRAAEKKTEEEERLRRRPKKSGREEEREEETGARRPKAPRPLPRPGRLWRNGQASAGSGSVPDRAALPYHSALDLGVRSRVA
jgi:hypothetical protein